MADRLTATERQPQPCKSLCHMAEQQPRRHAVRGQRPSSGGTSAGVPRPCQRGRLEQDPTDQIAIAWADGGSFILDTTGVGKGIADHLAAKGYAVAR